MQILEQAVKATGTLDDGKLADYIHRNEFDTIVGKIRFDARGEWATPRLLMIQYQNIQGNNLDQYRTILAFTDMKAPELFTLSVAPCDL
jgi:branched-chain amino acid transport system substrate-binding protein